MVWPSGRTVPLTYDENFSVACCARRHQGNCLPFLLYTPTWGSTRSGYPCCGLWPWPWRQLSPIPIVHAQCGGSPAVVLREATIWSLTSPLRLRIRESLCCASRTAAGCWGVPPPSTFDMMVAVVSELAHHFWMNPVFSFAHAFLRERQSVLGVTVHLTEELGYERTFFTCTCGSLVEGVLLGKSLEECLRKRYVYWLRHVRHRANIQCAFQAPFPRTSWQSNAHETVRIDSWRRFGAIATTSVCVNIMTAHSGFYTHW